MSSSPTGNTLTYSFSVTFVRNFLDSFGHPVEQCTIEGRTRSEPSYSFRMSSPRGHRHLFTAIYNPPKVFPTTASYWYGFLAQDWLNEPKHRPLSTIKTDVWRTTGLAWLFTLQDCRPFLMNSGKAPRLTGRTVDGNSQRHSPRSHHPLHQRGASLNRNHESLRHDLVSPTAGRLCYRSDKHLYHGTFSLGRTAVERRRTLFSFSIIVIALPVSLFLETGGRAMTRENAPTMDCCTFCALYYRSSSSFRLP